jgi:hypothetical protein
MLQSKRQEQFLVSALYLLATMCSLVAPGYSWLRTGQWQPITLGGCWDLLITYAEWADHIEKFRQPDLSGWIGLHWLLNQMATWALWKIFASLCVFHGVVASFYGEFDFDY